MFTDALHTLRKRRPHRSQGTATRFAALLVGVTLALSACTAMPDAQTTRDSLTEVTEPPEAEVEESLDEQLTEIEVEVQPCTPYLAVTVRGTGEPKKGQLLSPVSRAISDARPDTVEIVDLDYPASTEVHESAGLGVFTLVKMLNQQALACPEQRFALLGYSQGALVIGDALVGTDFRTVGAEVGELSQSASDGILAVVLYGDPRFVGAEPFNVGTYNPEVSGLLAREAGALDAYAERTADFCERRDFVCQSTVVLDEEGHVLYFDNGMQEEGAEFIIDRLVPLPGDRPVAVDPTDTAID